VAVTRLESIIERRELLPILGGGSIRVCRGAGPLERALLAPLRVVLSDRFKEVIVEHRDRALVRLALADLTPRADLKQGNVPINVEIREAALLALSR
jgi:hypothetical protein